MTLPQGVQFTVVSTQLSTLSALWRLDPFSRDLRLSNIIVHNPFCTPNGFARLESGHHKRDER